MHQEGATPLFQDLVESHQQWGQQDGSSIQNELSLDAINSCRFVPLQPFQCSLDFFMRNVSIQGIGGW